MSPKSASSSAITIPGPRPGLLERNRVGWEEVIVWTSLASWIPASMHGHPHPVGHWSLSANHSSKWLVWPPWPHLERPPHREGLSKRKARDDANTLTMGKTIRCLCTRCRTRRIEPQPRDTLNTLAWRSDIRMICTLPAMVAGEWLHKTVTTTLRHAKSAPTGDSQKVASRTSTSSPKPSRAEAATCFSKRARYVRY